MMQSHPISPALCDRCSRPARYGFAARDENRRFCLRHAVLYRPVVQRALRVALVVGTLLFLINQADTVIREGLSPEVALKVSLTYLVPFSVSTYSALQINRLPADEESVSQKP